MQVEAEPKAKQIALWSAPWLGLVPSAINVASCMRAVKGVTRATAKLRG